MATEKSLDTEAKGVQLSHHEGQTKGASLENLNTYYDDVEHEPEIHLKTYFAVAAMLFLNYVQIIALQGPPLVLRNIGENLNNIPTETWVPNALSLTQAVLAPIISSASDTFQARKLIMVVCCIISFVGSAIAPGSQNIYRLIGAQIMIGFGFSATALAYCVPSEVLPKKWRPMVQSFVNIAAALGACSGPLIIGWFCHLDPENGWRKYFWIQMGLWGATAVGIFVGYNPPKRYTVYDKTPLSQKIKALDLIGVGLFASALTLFLVGLNLGEGELGWTHQKSLGPLIVGLVTFIAFAVYEWKGTSTGIAHHDLFKSGKNAGRTYSIFLATIFIEGIMLFSFIIFYPVQTTSLFEQDTFLLAARAQPFWIGGGISTVIWGFWSVKARSIRVPLFSGFLIFTAGLVGLATIQPGDSTRSCIFAALAGIGFGAPLILIVAGIQLSAPHALIATATSLSITTRAISSSVFTAIYSAAFTEKIEGKSVSYVAKAATSSGLPTESIPAFIQAILTNNQEDLGQIRGVTSQVISAGVDAMKQASADSVRYVFIIAAPFGVLACFLCFFLDDQSAEMNYKVDAPVEDLRARK